MDRRSIGAGAEALAVAFLEREGYRVRARNVTCRHGELDVVAEREETLCFVEVRMRSTATFGHPALTVLSAKQRRVVKSALWYLTANVIRDKAIRFDVISVVGVGDAARVEHIPGAFDAGM